MPSWIAKALERIKKRVAASAVLFTLKARRELPHLALDEDDACGVLSSLRTEDSAGRLRSAGTGEWMYVFRPRVGGAVLYIKLILRSNFILISFHEDKDDEYEEEELT